MTLHGTGQIVLVEETSVHPGDRSSWACTIKPSIAWAGVGVRSAGATPGIRAFLAIAIDLFFVLTFDLAFGLFFFILRNMLKLLTAVFYLLTLPFRLLRWFSRKLERRFAGAAHSHSTAGPFKQSWPAFDEL